MTRCAVRPAKGLTEMYRGGVPGRPHSEGEARSGRRRGGSQNNHRHDLPNRPDGSGWRRQDLCDRVVQRDPDPHRRNRRSRCLTTCRATLLLAARDRGLYSRRPYRSRPWVQERAAGPRILFISPEHYKLRTQEADFDLSFRQLPAWKRYNEFRARTRRFTYRDVCPCALRRFA